MNSVLSGLSLSVAHPHFDSIETSLVIPESKIHESSLKYIIGIIPDQTMVKFCVYLRGLLPQTMVKFCVYLRGLLPQTMVKFCVYRGFGGGYSYSHMANHFKMNNHCKFYCKTFIVTTAIMSDNRE